LTGIFALLLWANLSSVALFLGIAFAAQLEAVRAGVPTPATDDPLAMEKRAHAATTAGTPSDLRPGQGAGGSGAEAELETVPRQRRGDRSR
jgi:hypothetical protein